MPVAAHLTETLRMSTGILPLLIGAQNPIGTFSHLLTQLWLCLKLIEPVNRHQGDNLAARRHHKQQPADQLVEEPGSDHSQDTLQDNVVVLLCPLEGRHQDMHHPVDSLHLAHNHKPRHSLVGSLGCIAHNLQKQML